MMANMNYWWYHNISTIIQVKIRIDGIALTSHRHSRVTLYQIYHAIVNNEISTTTGTINRIIMYISHNCKAI